MGNVDLSLDLFATNPIFTTLLSCMSDGILITDETGKVLCLNSAFQEHMGQAPNNADAPGHALVADMGLDRVLALAEHNPCNTDTRNTKFKSPLDQFVHVKEKIQSGTKTRDLEFYCGTIAVDNGKQRLKVVISQDHSPHKQSTTQPVIQDRGFITNDREMQAIMARLEQVADSLAPVLLMGESGTGKTQIARLIHQQSGRAHKPLIEVNCAAIPDQLLESELFGHVKGAFTGATQKRKGRFQAANGGVLLLDEIGEIPLHLQAKLLRAIQDQKFEPVGSDETVEVDVRVISATNRDLRAMVNNKKFRADLFYRLAVVPINIPPLRERVGDIPLLLKHFCTDLTARGYPNDVVCTPDAMRMMMDYPWPGNVREMINAVEHAYICAIDKSVLPESLPQEVRHHATGVVNASPFGTPLISQPFTTASPEAQSQAQEIADALSQTGHNKSHAAKRLGIDRTTLWRRMRKYGLA